MDGQSVDTPLRGDWKGMAAFKIGTDNSSVWLIRDVGAPGTRTVVGRKHGQEHCTPELISPQTQPAVIVTQQSGQPHPHPRTTTTSHLIQQLRE